MTVESRTDKQLTDKAQAEEAQNWASNLNQVRVTAHWGGMVAIGNTLGKHIGSLLHSIGDALWLITPVSDAE